MVETRSVMSSFIAGSQGSLSSTSDGNSSRQGERKAPSSWPSLNI